MKTPDKICVAPHQISDYDLDIQEIGHNGAEEYIRKDALLEWAKECFRLQDGGSWYSKGAADAFSKVINKLSEM